jgi:hypothetical protein
MVFLLHTNIHTVFRCSEFYGLESFIYCCTYPISNPSFARHDCISIEALPDP